MGKGLNTWKAPDASKACFGIGNGKIALWCVDRGVCFAPQFFDSVNMVKMEMRDADGFEGQVIFFEVVQDGCRIATDVDCTGQSLFV